MTTHELAALLLEQKDLPVIIDDVHVETVRFVEVDTSWTYLLSYQIGMAIEMDINQS